MATTNRQVLVVEDSPTQAMHLRAVLEAEGLQVAVAANGHEGLRLAHQLLPAVVVLDLEMPDLNGLQVCSRLKSDPETTYIPVILLTRFDTSDMVLRGLETGAIEYIPKDAFADAVLLESLRQMGILERTSRTG
jgi:CheY-like chemotaxis protein